MRSKLLVAFLCFFVSTVACTRLRAQIPERAAKPTAVGEAIDPLVQTALPPGLADLPTGPASDRSEAFAPAVSAGSVESVMLLPGQDPLRDYVDPAILRLENGDVLVAYQEWGFPDQGLTAEEEPPRILLTRSTDGGETWSPPDTVVESTFILDFYNLSMVQTDVGRILLTNDAGFAANRLFASDDDGASWEELAFDQSHGGSRARVRHRLIGPIGGLVWYPVTDRADGTVRVFESADGVSWTDSTGIRIPNPEAASTVQTLVGAVQLSNGDLVAALERQDADIERAGLDGTNGRRTFITRSSDGGLSWGPQALLNTDELDTYFGRLKRAPDGVLWYVFQELERSWYYCQGLPEADIFYLTSIDDGVTWSQPQQFTLYRGADFVGDLTFVDDRPLLAFMSSRFLPTPWSDSAPRLARRGMIWVGSPGFQIAQPSERPPVGRFGGRQASTWGTSEEIPVQVEAYDESGVASVIVRYALMEPVQGVWVFYYLSLFDPNSSQEIILYDDGLHGDGAAGDDLWGATLPPQPYGTVIVFEAYITDTDGNEVTSFGGRQWFPFGGGCNFSTAVAQVQSVHSVGTLKLAMRPDGRFGGYGFAVPVRPHGLMQWPGLEGQNYVSVARPVALAVAQGDTLAWGSNEEAGSVHEEAKISDQDITISGWRREELGLEITQRSFQWSDPETDDFVIIEYTLTNSGGKGDVEEIYMGLAADPEVTHETYNFDDLIGYDQGQHVLYAYDSGEACTETKAWWVRPRAFGTFECPTGYLGLTYLSEQDTPSGAVSGSYGGSCLTCDILPSLQGILTGVQFGGIFEAMTGGIDPILLGGVSIDPQDMVMMLSGGPKQIPVGDSATFAFGWVMGAGLDDMLANAAVMREVYETEVAGKATSSESTALVPMRFALHQNYPNPFNSQTAISFELPRPERVSVTVYNLLGERVATLLDEERPRGRHTITWGAAGLASGLYAYRLETGDFVATRKLLVLK